MTENGTHLNRGGMTILSAMTEIRLALSSEDDTQRLAGLLAGAMAPASVIGLTGDLGAGKTVFVRGFVRGLPGGRTAVVRSPTFTIMNLYTTRPQVCHMDLYRLGTVHQALASGLEEWCPFEGITLIEWPEHAAGLLPDDAMGLELSFGFDEEARTLDCRVPRSRNWARVRTVLTQWRCP